MVRNEAPTIGTISKASTFGRGLVFVTQVSDILEKATA